MPYLVAYLAPFPYLVLTSTPAKHSKSDSRDQLFLNFQTQDKWLRCLFNRIQEDDNVVLLLLLFFPLTLPPPLTMCF